MKFSRFAIPLLLIASPAFSQTPPAADQALKDKHALCEANRIKRMVVHHPLGSQAWHMQAKDVPRPKIYDWPPGSVFNEQCPDIERRWGATADAQTERAAILKEQQDKSAARSEKQNSDAAALQNLLAKGQQHSP